MCQSKKREKQIIIKNGPSEGCSSYCSFLLLTVIPKIHKWTGMKNLLLTMHSNSQSINMFNLFMGTPKIIWMQIKHWYKCFLHNFGCHFTEINKVLLN